VGLLTSRSNVIIVPKSAVAAAITDARMKGVGEQD
jgi:hypothetical protein